MCLIYSEGCYYLIAYNEKHDSFPSYRVDRMQGLRITDEAAVRNERIATFDAAWPTLLARSPCSAARRRRRRCWWRNRS